VARIDDLLTAALKTLPPKPPDTVTQQAKKRYSEQMSAAVALALGEELRERGMREARPAGPGEVGASGVSRRGESHPPPRSGPDVTVSRHPAPTVRP
jgi:hypothetical protein